MTKKNVGCIKNKAPLSGLTAKYRIPYIAIALIHHFGASKYGYYNWYNDPTNCNSSVSDNIDAIFRHITAHRIGKFIDPESGLPHIFHACCRAGMLITVYYRQDNDGYFIPKLSDNGKPTAERHSDVLKQITSEEVLVLTKDKLLENIDDPNLLSDHIFETLCRLDLFDELHVAGIALDDSYLCDIEDLVLSIWRYATLLVQRDLLVSYDIIQLSDEVQEFVRRYSDKLGYKSTNKNEEIESWTAQI